MQGYLFIQSLTPVWKLHPLGAHGPLGCCAGGLLKSFQVFWRVPLPMASSWLLYWPGPVTWSQFSCKGTWGNTQLRMANSLRPMPSLCMSSVWTTYWDFRPTYLTATCHSSSGKADSLSIPFLNLQSHLSLQLESLVSSSSPRPSIYDPSLSPSHLHHGAAILSLTQTSYLVSLPPITSLPLPFLSMPQTQAQLYIANGNRIISLLCLIFFFLMNFLCP